MFGGYLSASVCRLMINGLYVAFIYWWEPEWLEFELAALSACNVL